MAVGGNGCGWRSVVKESIKSITQSVLANRGVPCRAVRLRRPAACADAWDEDEEAPPAAEPPANPPPPAPSAHQEAAPVQQSENIEREVEAAAVQASTSGGAVEGEAAEPPMATEPAELAPIESELDNSEPGL